MPESLIYETIRAPRKHQRGSLHRVKRHDNANIGSILGIGFPATPGEGRAMNQCDGGLHGVLDRTCKLAACYGERSTPQKSLVDNAARNEVYQ
jgi:hypothetical protein